jgi:lipopolysaccharide assembly outer membrane protein LptD (OstA)
MNLRLPIATAICGLCAALAIAQSKDKTPPVLGAQKPVAAKPPAAVTKPLPDDIKTAKDAGAKESFKPSGPDDPYVYPYGDEGTYVDTPDGGIATLKGNARLLYKETKFQSAIVTYNRKTQIGTSPGKVTVNDAQNTITANQGTANYGKKLVNLIGDVHITARPKQDASTAPDGSVRKEFASPVDIRGSKVDYSWKTKTAILSSDTVITFRARERNWTVTADNLEYRGGEEKALLRGNLLAKSDKGEILKGKSAIVILTDGKEAIDIAGVEDGSKFKVDDEDDKATPPTDAPKAGGLKSPSKPGKPDKPETTPPPSTGDGKPMTTPPPPTSTQ